LWGGLTRNRLAVAWPACSRRERKRRGCFGVGRRFDEHGHLMADEAIAIAEERKTETVISVATLFPRRIHGKEHGPQAISGVFEAKERECNRRMSKNTGPPKRSRAVCCGGGVGNRTTLSYHTGGLPAGEFTVYVSLGMTPLAAIQRQPHQRIRLARAKRSCRFLEQGRWADLLAVDERSHKRRTISSMLKFV